MKKRVKVFIAALFTVLLCTFGGMNVFAMGLGTEVWEINTEFANAPEGTAFTDILFPKKENDKYLAEPDSGDKEKENICTALRVFKGGSFTDTELDRNCGLAEYDDGYTSCMMRRYFVSINFSFEHRTTLFFPIPSNVDNDEVFRYYGSFKVAYCDEKGNVLGVTGPVKVKTYKRNGLYEIRTDGTKAKYHFKGDNSIFLEYGVKGLIVFAAIAVALIVTLTVYLCVRPKKKQQYHR